MNQKFWHEQVALAITPLVDNAALVTTVATVWLQTLSQAGYLNATADGWQWVKPLPWFVDGEHKLAALR
ncbi:hypothetical protein [Lacticaseibacillus manihotivorans]|nr:hypothetical protein [Lacticaseibacillus manihotivorans]